MSTIRELSLPLSRSLPSLRELVALPATGMGCIVRTAGLWYRRHNERRTLAALPDYLLKDIGLSDADVWAESRKWFWQE